MYDIYCSNLSVCIERITYLMYCHYIDILIRYYFYSLTPNFVVYISSLLLEWRCSYYFINGLSYELVNTSIYTINDTLEPRRHLNTYVSCNYQANHFENGRGYLQGPLVFRSHSGKQTTPRNVHLKHSLPSYISVYEVIIWGKYMGNHIQIHFLLIFIIFICR